MSGRKRKIRVAITMGDPSGIGPSIIAKSVSLLRGTAEFIIIGDKGVFDRLPRAKRGFSRLKFVDLDNVSRKDFSFGKISVEYGRASIEYLDKALALVLNRQVDCLVTCPISKEAVNLAGFAFSGHTEYFALRAHTDETVMMLLNKYLKIALVTRHIPLNTVSSQINKHKILKTILAAHKALRELFLVKNPKLVVCGLNPHASDNGLIGREESEIIRPALKDLLDSGIYADGPFSADAAILMALNKKYDAAVAIYHDQALIALKATDAYSGVNITLGLPFIRTSPLHGTAFDIASDYRASDPRSLVAAIKTAIKCYSNLKKA
jgi:4-hydroxythreonine-4-phosphate dehydrogenase